MSVNTSIIVMKEFDLIDRFFKNQGHSRRDVVVGIGDDCAVMTFPAQQQLVVTTDSLVEGVHFLPNSDPHAVAYKSVAVNLSDLAAMGAEPSWLSMSLSIPSIDETWLEGFADGFYQLLKYYSVQLIGGDTVQGPLAITITAQGFVPPDNQLTRSGARPGDLIYVTGTLGDAGAGLEVLRNGNKALSTDQQFVADRYMLPTPRVMMGTSLRRIANSCIDVSDGFVADLKHILNASSVGARIDVEKLPVSESLVNLVGKDKALEYALTAGDDYELLFTVSEEQKGQLETVLGNINEHATCIGQLNGHSGQVDLRLNDQHYALSKQAGFEHFSG